MAKVAANMAGTVWKVLVAPGETVTPGQDVVILESMKMEIPVSAEIGGTVGKILRQPGDFVDAGDPLLELEGL